LAGLRAAYGFAAVVQLAMMGVSWRLRAREATTAQA